MKISYLLYFDLSAESGVTKKIIRQVVAWEALGATVKIFAVTSNKSVWKELEELDLTIYYCRSIVERVSQNSKATKAILEWNPALVYLRSGLFFESHLKLAKRIATVVEVNTDEVAEKRKTLGFAKFSYYQYMRRKLYTKAVGFVCVTYELRDTISVFRKKSIIISNSINLSNFPVPGRCNSQNRIRAIYLGTGGENNDWNGIDKIIRFAKSAPEITFDLVGAFNPERFEVASNNVIFHGFLSSIKYQKLIERATVGIGSLAAHRKNMNEACPLKVREYLANGLPVIIGYTDSDFLGDYNFIFQMENTETNVEDNIECIRKFCSDWLGKRVPRSEVAHLDTNVKERARMSFFIECGNNND